jgi:hypothetical protein
MSDTQDSQKTPNFSAAVDHFNSVSYWTQGLILSQNSPGKDATDLRERILNNVSSVFFFFLDFVLVFQNPISLTQKQQLQLLFRRCRRGFI